MAGKKSPRATLKVHRFFGVSLGGGKTDRTCAAVLEYFPQNNKIFLSRLFEKIKSTAELSSDSMLDRLISSSGELEGVALDVPWRLPKCMRCRLKCPGFESCTEPEIEWMWRHYRSRKPKGKQIKLFTPYTERCVELYLSTELEETFHLSHALGANLAPLTARANYISRRITLPLYEVYPKLSLWRIGRSLGIAKSHLNFHRHAISGADSRHVILEKLVDQNLVFLYEQDHRALINNPQAFDAFLCVLTAVLSFKGQCEPRPRDFPKSETWISIPKQKVDWT